MLTDKDFLKVYKKLGIKCNDNIMIHASLRNLGFILNYAHDVIDPLLNLVKKDGAVLVSGNTGNITDPKYWKTIKKNEYKKARSQIRTYDPKTSIPYNRGKLPEVFLTYPNLFRSSHPTKSVMAIGKNAKYFTSYQDLYEPEGVNSPMYKLYKKKGHALFIDTDLSKFSAMHIAETLADVSYLYTTKCFVMIKDNKKNRSIKLKKYSIALNFNRIQKDLFKRGFIKTTTLNKKKIHLVKIKESVDYATKILKDNPEFFLYDINGKRNEV